MGNPGLGEWNSSRIMTAHAFLLLNSFMLLIIELWGLSIFGLIGVTELIVTEPLEPNCENFNVLSFWGNVISVTISKSLLMFWRAFCLSRLFWGLLVRASLPNCA